MSSLKIAMLAEVLKHLSIKEECALTELLGDDINSPVLISILNENGHAILRTTAWSKRHIKKAISDLFRRFVIQNYFMKEWDYRLFDPFPESDDETSILIGPVKLNEMEQYDFSEDTDYILVASMNGYTDIEYTLKLETLNLIT